MAKDKALNNKTRKRIEKIIYQVPQLQTTSEFQIGLGTCSIGDFEESSSDSD
jgi:hypothetical protein